jgi:phosphatidylinositol glycan class A protein
MIGRLTFRKGIDLLVDVIPGICSRFPEAYFIIGGDGPKGRVLEDMIRKNNLQGRVELVIL